MNEPDEHEGRGGSYTLDPKTGKRTLVERTQPAPAAESPPAAEPVIAPLTAAPSRKHSKPAQPEGD